MHSSWQCLTLAYPNDFMKPEETIDFHLRRTWQSVVKYYNEVAENYGVSMATGFVLLTIDREKGTPSTALGPRMGMGATSLSRLLKNMEDQELIQRRPNPDDGRGVLVSLTDYGREKREDAKAAVLNFNHFVYDHFSREQLETTLAVMEEIHHLASEHSIPTDPTTELNTREP